jgi:hypothetical protein
MTEDDRMNLFEPQGKPSLITKQDIVFNYQTVKRLGDGQQVTLISWGKRVHPIDGPVFGKPLVVEMSINNKIVIDEIVRGSIGDARMFAKQKHAVELPDLWVERWKGKPCMHAGVPNKNAMRLLTGLRKRILPGYLVTKDGTGYPDRRIGGLAQAGLIGHDGVIIRGVEGFRTNLLGYEVLTHWADTRKAFTPFFKVFCPENWERDYKAKQVMDVLQGSKDHPLPPLLRAAMSAAGGMASPPYAKR